jgi:hypothetical protein
MPILESDKLTKHLNLFSKGLGAMIEKLIKVIQSKQDKIDHTLLSENLTYDFIYDSSASFDIQMWFEQTPVGSINCYTQFGFFNLGNSFSQSAFSNGDKVRLKLGLQYANATGLTDFTRNVGNVISISIGFTLINFTKNVVYTGTILTQNIFTHINIQEK